MRSKHIFVKVVTSIDGPQFELALLDLEKSHRRITSLGAARHDLRQLRRHSSWTDIEWAYFLKVYHAEFGRSV